ncbi:restriction endonuclease [Microbulbifer yueqingensis]|uniref:Restriction system protein n=1 Tax=Microbulbifer yueqingensis TaxID=658219 RepID=A0A1G9A3G6_9GAMM|nr:restriction endonuclease [Microbulbifer yueqingensis]SDK21787.1 restriction system protein [Microbulbifer yueqingensis]
MIGKEAVDISPEQFELQVKDWISGSVQNLENFEVSHLNTLNGDSGEYEIDVTAEFTVFGGAKIKVLIECKRYSGAVKRDVIMVLESKLRDSNAHKGMVFSTSGFQRGAIEYATKRGIATITIQNGNTNFVTRSAESGPSVTPPWVKTSEFIGWFVTLNEDERQCFSLVESGRLEPLLEWCTQELA